MVDAALVAGGTGDIGSAVVKRLRSAGWEVGFTFHRDVGGAQRLAQDTGATAIQSLELSSDAKIRSGRLGALVNCIGINPIDKSIDLTPVEVFREILETNLVEALRLAQSALPALARGNGTIVNISSIWGFRAAEGIVGYVASKHGMRGLTATLARECGPLGVTCNEICPGALDSRMMRACAARDVGPDPRRIEESIREIAARTPIRRLVAAEEIAAAAAFLCSRECRGMNGASIVIDGGMTA